MFHVITSLICLYVLWRFVWPLHCDRTIKALLAVVIMLVSQHHLVTRTFFGTMASPEVPRAVLLGLGWSFGALILAACLLLIRDLTGLAIRLFSKPTGQSVLGSRRAGQAIVVAAMALSAVGVWQAVRVPHVRTVTIAVAGLPAGFDGLRMVQLTDLHASRLLQRDWIEAVVAKTNALKPDITVITGDLIDGSVAARAADVQPLRDLSAPLGVFAIPGNHEYYSEYVDWMAAFDALGLRMLPNKHAVVSRGGDAIVIAGVTDKAASMFKQPLPDVKHALAGAPAGAPVVLLSHRPLGAAASAEAGAQVQLSGHTHGGQILGLHFFAQMLNDGFVSGLYDVNGMQLYVSNGAGLWNGFPIRLARPSEITLIVFKAAP